MLTEHEVEQLRLALQECEQRHAIETAIADAGTCLQSFVAPKDDETCANAA